MSVGQFLVPCQLPDPPAWLAGRDAEINALDQLLGAPEGWPLTVVVSGVPGVGKTALASWWLHEHRRQFSEGQFYGTMPVWPVRSEWVKRPGRCSADGCGPSVSPQFPSRPAGQAGRGCGRR